MYVRTKIFKNKSSKIKRAPPGGKKYLVRKEVEGMAYETFRVMGIRVLGRVLEAGEGESVVEPRGQCIRKQLLQEDFFCRGCQNLSLNSNFLRF